MAADCKGSVSQYISWLYTCGNEICLRSPLRKAVENNQLSSSTHWWKLRIIESVSWYAMLTICTVREKNCRIWNLKWKYFVLTPLSHNIFPCSSLCPAGLRCGEPMPGLRGNIWKVRAKINKTSKRGAGSIVISSINLPYQFDYFDFTSFAVNSDSKWFQQLNLNGKDSGHQVVVAAFFGIKFDVVTPCGHTPWMFRGNPEDWMRFFSNWSLCDAPRSGSQSFTGHYNSYTNRIWTCRDAASNFLNLTLS